MDAGKETSSVTMTLDEWERKLREARKEGLSRSAWQIAGISVASAMVGAGVATIAIFKIYGE